MRKLGIFRSKYPLKITTVLTVLFIVLALISSSSISITINNISKTENIKIKEETQISKESLTGLAPLTIEALSTDLAPIDSNNALKPLRYEKMYGYTAEMGPHGEGPCYWDMEAPDDIIQLSTQKLPNFAAGGTYTCDGRWIVCEYSNGALYEIDPETGDISDGWGGSGGTGLNGLAEDPTSMTMYGCSSNDLYKIDVETGDLEYIGPFDISGAMIAIAFSPYGECYGWDVKFSGNSKLYTIDLDEGTATEKWDLGFNLIYAQDGDFNREDELLYLSAYISGSGGHLITVDPDNGEVVIIDSFENSAEITGSMIKGCGWGPEHDVGVKKIVSPEDGDAGEDMDVIVRVRNYGNNTEEDISVNVVILKDGNIEEYNETEIIDELPFDESIDVEMPVWTPDDWQSVSNGYIDYKIAAKTTLKGDHNPRNDYKEKWFELNFGYFHDVGFINFSGPEIGPAQTFPVNVTIKNFGQYDECCFKTYVEISELDLEYEDFKCIPTIEPGQEIELVFDDWTPDFLKYETSGTKNYTINVWNDMDDPPDENPVNDIITKNIILDYYHDVGIREVDSPKLVRGNRKFYAVDCSSHPSSRLIWFDPGHPGTFHYICGFPSSSFPQGATFVCNVLWVCDTMGNIWKVNPETGEVVSVGSTGTGACNALAFHEVSGKMYGCSSSQLYEIDMDDGSATVIGTFGGGSNLMISLDCDEWSGFMYAYDLNFGNSALWSIDLDTGAATKIGNIGFSANYGQDMAYDCVNKTMYACVFNYGSFQGEFRRVDLETGEFNFIGVLQNGAQTTAFAIPGCCLTPKAYVPIGVESIVTIVENIGTFPETDMVCYAKMYEYITNCSNGSLVYEDNITNIDLEEPLGSTETLTFNDYNFEVEGFYGLFIELVDNDDDYPDNNLFTWGIGCDDTPPSSTHSLDPPEPDGLNGWYVSDLEVTLSAKDPRIGCEYLGSGVDYIAYEIDGVPGRVPGRSGTFTIKTEGDNVLVEYWAVDMVGNVESRNSFTVDMDQTPPVIDLTYEWERRSRNSFTIDMDQTPPVIDLTYKWEGSCPAWIFHFIANATDATSGMERVEFYLNEGLQETVYGPGPEYIFSLLWMPPPFELWVAFAYDWAGNYASDFIEKPGATNDFIIDDTRELKNEKLKFVDNHILLNFLEGI